MSSQLNHFPQEDLDSTTDEDLCLGLKVRQLQSLKSQQLSEDVSQILDKTTIRRLDFGGLVKVTPFQKHSLETASSTKSDLPESKSSYGAESQDFLKGSPTKSRPKMFPEGILKSGEKSKYKKWHQYLLDCQVKGIAVDFGENSEVNFLTPYFVKGIEENWEYWDKNKWKEEEEWWEDDQWVLNSPTYAKFRNFPNGGFDDV